jgi:hypothetical protein
MLRKEHVKLLVVDYDGCTARSTKVGLQAKECDAFRDKLICVRHENLLRGILTTIQGGALRRIRGAAGHAIITRAVLLAQRFQERTDEGGGHWR